MRKRIYLNAFDMNCVGHQSPGLWTHPEDEADCYKDLDYWIDLAQLLERGKFDGLFLADVLGIYDVYENSKDTSIRQAAQVPVNDPMLLISAMAHATSHLGFGVTCSLTYEHPYSFARRMSTLDHLTKGRIAWNIVTSYLDSAAKNLGLDQQINHHERYEIAEEYMQVCYKLWEGSWEENAVVKDKEKKIFADPNKVHEIRHKGKYFRVPGAHLCEPSPQRTPVLYQAGASSKGREFAAKHAECVFVSFPSIKTAAQYVKDIRERARKYGRDPESILIFNLFTPIVGKTEEEAWGKYHDLSKHISYEGALALLGGWTGIDFSKYDPDQKIEYMETNAVKSAVEKFTKANPDKQWTVRELANFVGIGGAGPLEIGSPKQIADALERWTKETGVDGFNIAYATTPGTFKDFIELVVPELQSRGVLKTKYEEGTYREKLFGNGKARLSDKHLGSNYRKLFLQS
ncbi:FMN-dependent oxidoreductase (nitrilotriacetate monooxygenase family) [Bacillus fengqiuensis]|nr:FMN-dependent oxidoreductase (nitrilotriacetate monooxygenase family) [Bacillus fengqiuensis]